MGTTCEASGQAACSAAASVDLPAPGGPTKPSMQRLPEAASMDSRSKAAAGGKGGIEGRVVMAEPGAEFALSIEVASGPAD